MLLACGDSDGALFKSIGEQEGGEQREVNFGEVEISEEDLADMVLSLGDYGPEYEDFELDDESGPQSRADEVDGACDPEDETEDLDRTGWVASYERYYNLDVATAERLVDSSFTAEGTLVIGTWLGLFQTVDGAVDYFRDSIQESFDEIGTECHGLILGEVDEFDLLGIGEDAWGGSIGFTPTEWGDKDVDGVMAVVSFRRGCIVASVAIAAVNQSVDEYEVIGLARKLDARILSILEE
jgi:hypothetical protein